MDLHPRAPRSWCQREPSDIFSALEACKRCDSGCLVAQKISTTVSVCMAHLAHAASTAARFPDMKVSLLKLCCCETVRKPQCCQSHTSPQAGGRVIKLIRVQTHLRDVQRQTDILQAHNVSFKQPLGVMLSNLLACHSYDTRCVRPMSRLRPRMNLLLCLHSHNI